MASIKRRKGIKGATIAICSIATVALVGVGFGAWVITGGSSKDATGNFVVDVVSDSSYTIELNQGWVDDKSDIVFGIPEGSDDESYSENHATWLAVDNTVGYENLSVTKEFKIYNVDSTCNLADILSVSIALQDPSQDYDELSSVQYKYIGALPNTDDGSLYLAYPDDLGASGALQDDQYGTYAECSATATFSWGEAFGGMNPYFYSYEVQQYEEYSSEEISGTIVSQSQFQSALQTLYADLNGLGFTMTIIAAGK